MSDQPDITVPSLERKEQALSIDKVVTTIEDTLVLTLHIDDPEMVLELKKFSEGNARDSFAVAAMRIGILALRQAKGQVDAETLRNEGNRLLSEMKHELQSHIVEMDTKVATTLKHYFDPKSGHFTERVGASQAPSPVPSAQHPRSI